ncbi:hypothetical protein HDU86_006269 [Geranomyces michiganensis]|nr:hypothetical protein HDU86_006269 [Geranomyces michiganensis]
MSFEFSSPPGSPCLTRQNPSPKQYEPDAELQALMAKNPTMTWEDLIAAARAFDPDCLPGLREVLRIGANSLSDVTLPEDIEVAGVKISSLLRLVFCDVLVDVQLPDKEKEFSRKSVLRAVYPRLTTQKSFSKEGSEASWIAKYHVPHFEQLVRDRSWRLEVDTTASDRQRPDLSVLAHGRRIFAAEVKTPFSTTSKRELPLQDGLLRARMALKAYVKAHNWGKDVPSLFTAIAPDGINFDIYKACLYGSIYTFCEIGCAPVTTSLYNMGNLACGLSVFEALAVRGSP